jgi:alpha-tubulin suppressor-like RCC1 family protein
MIRIWVLITCILKVVVTQATCGMNHTCALIPDGTVQCWKFNEYGQIGEGTTVATSVSLASLSDIPKQLLLEFFLPPT